MDFLKNKYVTYGVGAALVLGLVYYVWTSTGSGALLTTTEEGTSPLSQEILITLGQLQTIELEPSIFTDPAFVSLTDFGVTIPPQTAGRRNPFAPVGSTGGAAAQ
jgi:hypothetical protein